MAVRVSGDDVVKILSRYGFIHDTWNGGHHILMHHRDCTHRVVVPRHSILKPGTLRIIFKNAGLTDVYDRLVKDGVRGVLKDG